MWKILFVFTMVSDYHYEPAVTSQLIGEYKNVTTCQTIAKQLEEGYPKTIAKPNGYALQHLKVLVKCVQVKEK